MCEIGRNPDAPDIEKRPDPTPEPPPRVERPDTAALLKRIVKLADMGVDIPYGHPLIDEARALPSGTAGSGDTSFACSCDNEEDPIVSYHCPGCGGLCG